MILGALGLMVACGAQSETKEAVDEPFVCDTAGYDIYVSCCREGKKETCYHISLPDNDTMSVDHKTYDDQGRLIRSQEHNYNRSYRKHGEGSEPSFVSQYRYEEGSMRFWEVNRLGDTISSELSVYREGQLIKKLVFDDGEVQVRVLVDSTAGESRWAYLEDSDTLGYTIFKYDSLGRKVLRTMEVAEGEPGFFFMPVARYEYKEGLRTETLENAGGDATIVGVYKGERMIEEYVVGWDQRTKYCYCDD